MTYLVDRLTMPVEAIDRVEVIKGPMSITYGSGAFYGVINIVTNQPTDSGKSLAAVKYGSEESKGAVLRLIENNDSIKYAINAYLYGADGIDEPFTSYTSAPLAGFGIEEGSTTANYFNRDSVYIDFSASSGGFSANGIYRELNKGIFINPPAPTGGTNAWDTREVYLNLGYTKTFGDNVQFNSRISYYDYHGKFDVDIYSTEGDFDQNDINKIWEGEAVLTYSPTEDLTVTHGVSYRSSEKLWLAYSLALGGVYRDEKGLENNALVNRAFFTQAKYRFNKWFSTVAGIRFDQIPEYDYYYYLKMMDGSYTRQVFTISHDDVEVIPRVAAIFDLDENNSVKLLYGKANNQPAFFQDVLSTSLKPEEIETWEISYIGRPFANTVVNASVFRNNLTSQIIRKLNLGSDGSVNSEYSNAGEMETTGVEVSIKTQIGNFNLELAGTYQSTTDNSPGRENVILSHSPEFLGYLKAAYNINEDAILAVTGRYVDEMYAFWDPEIMNTDGSLGARTGEKMDAYFDFGANFRMENIGEQGFFMNVRISNLLDEDIRIPATPNNSWADKGILQGGRTALVTVGKTF